MRNLLYCLLLTISLHSLGNNNLEEAYLAMRKVYKEGTIPQAQKEALKFLSLAKQKDNPYFLVKAYFMLGYLASESDDFGNAVIYYLEGARFAEQSRDEESKQTLVSIYKNLGWIVGDYQHYKLSHKFINQGLRTASALDNEVQIKQLLENRIHELLKEKLYSEAIHQIDSFLTIYPSESTPLQLRLKNKAGIAYKNIGQKETAISHYEYVIRNGKELSPELYAKALHNLGNIYVESKDYSKALSLYQKSISVTQSIGIHHLLFSILESTGNTYYLQGDYTNAIQYLQKAVSIEQKRNLEPDSYTVYEKLSNVYEKHGDIQQALHYKNIYARKLEAFIAEQKKIEELDKRYNIQLLTERYFDLLAANKKQERTERIAAIGAGAIILIFLLIIFNIYYKQYRVKHSIKQELKKIQLMDFEL